MKRRQHVGKKRARVAKRRRARRERIDLTDIPEVGEAWFGSAKVQLWGMPIRDFFGLAWKGKP